MGKIDELIKRHCPNGVSLCKLDELLGYEQPSAYIVKSTEYDDKYNIPVLTAGQSFILGYTNETEGIFRSGKDNPVIIFDDFTTGFHWVDFDFKVKSSAMKMLRPIGEKAVFRYVYYAMQNIHFTPSEHARHWISKYSQFEIPLPPIPVQQEIVRILNSFVDLQDNLQQELEARRKQYEVYREKLLSFNDIGGGIKWKWSRLVDMLCQPISDGPHESPVFFQEGIPFISVDAIVNNKIDFSRKRGYISEEYDIQCRAKYSPQRDDVYMVKSGSTTGKVAIVNTDIRFNIWSPLAAMRVNSDNSPRYLYYLLQTDAVQSQVKDKCSKGSQPNLSMRVLEQFDVKVPSLSDQKKCVDILDAFVSVLDNLEMELATRQKQYEYYREQLLTF